MRNALSLGLVVLTAIAGCAQNNEPPRSASDAVQPEHVTVGSQDAPNSFGTEVPLHNASPTVPYANPTTGDLVPKTAMSDQDQAQAGAKTNATLSDGEVIGVLMAANDGEVQMASLALMKGKTDAVKDFATMMKQHHNEGLNKTRLLAKNTKIAPAESDVSTHLKSEVDGIIKDLKAKKGAEFDAAYMDAQVKAHKEVLQIVDDRLTPSAQNGRVADAVFETKRLVEAHLNRAIDVDKNVGSGISMRLTPKQRARAMASN